MAITPKKSMANTAVKKCILHAVYLFADSSAEKASAVILARQHLASGQDIRGSVRIVGHQETVALESFSHLEDFLGRSEDFVPRSGAPSVQPLETPAEHALPLFERIRRR